MFHVKQRPCLRKAGTGSGVLQQSAVVESITMQASAIGVTLPGEQAELLALHVSMVYEANRIVNLTRISREDAICLHVIDSLSGLQEMNESPDGPWLDIGSGAGFPGVPLAVAGGRHVDLLESVGRKAAFLSAVVEGLRLDATVRGCRAEDAAQATPGLYAAVAVRAVSELPALVELASPLLMRGGVLVCWKGDPSSEELERGVRVAAITGMRHVRDVEVRLPASEALRTIVVYERVDKSAVSLPRRIGLAQSKPLA
jgi:16S rRNA (guanine527-N7)-methyltransferase